MKKQLTCRHTTFACFIGCIVQAILSNFTPLLFLTFQSSCRIPPYADHDARHRQFPRAAARRPALRRVCGQNRLRASMGIAHLISALGLALLRREKRRAGAAFGEYSLQIRSAFWQRKSSLFPNFFPGLDAAGPPCYDKGKGKGLHY